MRHAIPVLALAGVVAVRAAPIATETDWSAIWQSQLASMASVESAMGQQIPTGAVAVASNGPPSMTTNVDITSTVVSQITMTSGANAAAASSVAGDMKVASYPAVTPAAGTPSVALSSAVSSAVSSAASAAGPAGGAIKVTNSAAWQQDQGNSGPPAVDSYKCYPGTPGSFPTQDKWSSFDDLWNSNMKLLQGGCTSLGYSPDNTDTQIPWIKDAIRQVASESLVDPRVILATMMQESHGCLAVGTTANSVANPGLMQSHDGTKFVGASASEDQQKQSIVQMIRDGTEGTSSGDGLVQLINKYGDVFTASRAYNSGDSGVTKENLSLGNGATPSYVNDIANRLTGWSLNPGISPKCSGES